MRQWAGQFIGLRPKSWSWGDDEEGEVGDNGDEVGEGHNDEDEMDDVENEAGDEDGDVVVSLFRFFCFLCIQKH
jgi:hypothetical protein